MSKTKEEMQEKYGNAHFRFDRNEYDCRDTAFVTKYVRKESPFYRLIADEQRTVPRTKDGTYEGVLTPSGQALLDEILKKVERKDYKDTIWNAKIELGNSGYWKDTSPGGLMHLNTWNDRVIVGTRASDGVHVNTSPLIFFSKKDCWGYTYTGSLYRIHLLSSAAQN